MFPEEAKSAARQCLDTVGCMDAIGLAGQIGRLDLVSSLLTALGLMIVLSGVFAYINFRNVARRQAKEEAENIARETAEQKINEYLQAEMPNILEEYWQFIGRAPDDSEQADEIANAQETGDRQ